MTYILSRIHAQARTRASAPAVADQHVVLGYAGLAAEIERLAPLLDGARVGLLLDNGAHWACLDLALQSRRAVCVPMPAFFSAKQLAHLVYDAGLDLIATDDPARLVAVCDAAVGGSFRLLGRALHLLRPSARYCAPPAMPAGTAKITYTSGTTGTPKGVCLSQSRIDDMAEALARAVQAGPADRTLSLLPLSVLLENIGGLYAPLCVGALAQLPALSGCGLRGSSAIDTGALFAALSLHAPSTLILVPQLLKVLAAGATAGLSLPRSLRFVAVGGAPLASSLLRWARALGIPAYQGYGLSEACSVVCLNLPGAQREGSVGKPLPNVRIAIDDSGEVVVADRLFLGYLGQGGVPNGHWRTGDFGYVDSDGYLYLSGRRKTAYATAFGRKLAPEWVESELCAHPLILQAAVFGESRPCNVAVLVAAADTPFRSLASAVDAVNGGLPDYAHIAHWIAAEAPFGAANGLARASGAIDREAIARHYRTRIERLYSAEEEHVVF